MRIDFLTKLCVGGTKAMRKVIFLRFRFFASFVLGSILYIHMEYIRKSASKLFRKNFAKQLRNLLYLWIHSIFKNTRYFCHFCPIFVIFILKNRLKKYIFFWSKMLFSVYTYIRNIRKWQKWPISDTQNRYKIMT